MKTIVCNRCPVCSSKQSYAYFEANKESKVKFLNLSRMKYRGYMDRWLSDLSLEVKKCLQCGHLYHHMQPDQDALFGMYHARVSLASQTKKSEPSNTMIKQMKAFHQLVVHQGGNGHKLTLLDYGSGRGTWSKAADIAGFKVTSYEPVSSRNLRQSNIEVLDEKNRVEDINGRKFDAIILEQVLEHVPQPVELLRSLKIHCNPNTVVRISVPNIDRKKYELKNGWDGYPFNGKTMHIMSPYEHLHGFSHRSFVAAIKAGNFKHFNDFAIWKTHSVNRLRRLIGAIIPRINQTRAFLYPR